MRKFGTMDLILLIIGVFLALFTTAMIVIHCITGSTPDTLITCVFGICGIEGGVMGWIKTAKMKKLNENLNENRKNANADLRNHAEVDEICEITEV